MKSPTLIVIFIIINLPMCGQSIFGSQAFEHSYQASSGLYSSEQLLFSDRDVDAETPSFGLFVQPLPPLLTSLDSELEICTGSSAHLTASSTHMVYWYTTPPPLGAPVGTGTSYVTPPLSTGYYTYYAIAEHNGVKSDVAAMEVVMVYPAPVLHVSSSTETLCANETATLTVTGTTYYAWENGPVASQMRIQPEQTQTFKVMGINTAGCKSYVEYTQVVEICQATDASAFKQVSQLSSEEESRIFSVFPNPNNGEFNVHIETISENTRIEVYNVLGQLTYRFKVTSAVSKVALNDSPDGIYIVRILENEKVLNQQKIIKE